MLALLSFALAIAPFLLFVALFAHSHRVGAIGLLIYLAIYLPFSFRGEYQTANHGGMDWRDYWCAPGFLEKFQPERIGWNGRIYRGRSQVQFTWLGTFFWPLVVLDNLVLHPTKESDLSRNN